MHLSRRATRAPLTWRATARRLGKEEDAPAKLARTRHDIEYYPAQKAGVRSDLGAAKTRWPTSAVAPPQPSRHKSTTHVESHCATAEQGIRRASQAGTHAARHRVLPSPKGWVGSVCHHHKNLHVCIFDIFVAKQCMHTSRWCTFLFRTSICLELKTPAATSLRPRAGARCDATDALPYARQHRDGGGTQPTGVDSLAQ